MDAVVDALHVFGERVDLLFTALASQQRVTRKFHVMASTRGVASIMVVVLQVSDAGASALAVEGVAFVRHGEIGDAIRLEFSQKARERRDWVFTMLDEVVGDNEVKRGVRDQRQAFAVVDNVGGKEFFCV